MAGAGEGWVGSAACQEAVPEANTVPKAMGRHRKPEDREEDTATGSPLQVLPSSTPAPQHPPIPKPFVLQESI